MKRLFEDLYHISVKQDSLNPKDVEQNAFREKKASFGVHLVALSLNKMGDTLADAKLVLPWLFTALGVPVYLTAWLVPIREALALLPQFFIANWTQKFAVRKYLWCIGSVIQGLCILAIALVPWVFDQFLAGMAILMLLSLFSLARCLCSITVKDVQGKTVDKQQRGQVSGLATSIAGVFALLFALAVVFDLFAVQSIQTISIILTCASSCWLLAALVYAQLPEFPDQPDTLSQPSIYQLEPYLELLTSTHVLRFLWVRSLLISTALVAPFYVILASKHSQNTISALGTLLLLVGLANSFSGWFWGQLADLSSRVVMAIAGMICAGLALAVTLALWFELPLSQSYLWYGGVLFLLYVGHAGVRLGRATYLLDMSNSDNRTRLVALSNTVIGVVLLVVAALISSLGGSTEQAIILGLGVCSATAAVFALRLPEVTKS